MSSSDDEDADISESSILLTKTSHVFTALHTLSEFDEEEDVECRILTTMYAGTRGTAPLTKLKDDPATYLGPVSLDILSPWLCTLRIEDPLLFKCVIQMRIIVGEPPAKEPKSWRRKRMDAIATCRRTPSSHPDPSSFVETIVAEGSIQSFLCCVLLLMDCPSTSIKLGPVASKFLTIQETSSEMLICKILKKICDSASMFACRKSLGEKLDPNPPIRGIKVHPITFLLFNNLLKTLGKKDDWSRELNDSLVYACRALALNLWFMEVTDIKPAIVGLGLNSDVDEKDALTSLVPQCNQNEIVNQIKTSLWNFSNRIKPLEQNNRFYEECSFAWGAGLQFFYPTHEERLELFLNLITKSSEFGDGTHYLLENLCCRIASCPNLSKPFSILPNILDLLLNSIQKSIAAERPSTSVSFIKTSFQEIPTSAAIQNVPLSPASSTGGASVFSIMSRKRGDDDEEDDENDEVGSLTGQTRARSIGTSSVTSSLITVTEENSQHGDLDQFLPGEMKNSLSSSLNLLTKSLLPSTQASKLATVKSTEQTDPDVIRPPYLKHFQRTRLLWLFQGMGMIRYTNDEVMQQHQTQQQIQQEQQNLVVFDEPRCAESIQIITEGRKAIQKSDKKWGTAISSYRLNASIADVFRWRIKVDKCEDGHVFFGVATRDATSSTYLGEDANGWGFIGKAHLWHNKEKKGSYGEPIRTGETVTVTLDCKKGTLSFANVSRDFGVAFRNLKEYCTGNSNLYPAVALYEKGDAVTFLPLSSPSDDFELLSSGISKGMFWSNLDGPQALEKSLNLGDRFFSNISFFPPESHLTHLENILDRVASLSDLSTSTYLTSSLSAFCLWPNNRISPNIALRLLRKATESLQSCYSLQPSTTGGLAPDMSGKWWFIDSPTTRQQVELQQDQNSSIVRGTIHSKRDGIVKITGSIKDFKVVLTENWKSANRIVKLRLMPDSKVALGYYQTESKQPTTIRSMIAIRISKPNRISSPLALVLSNLIGKLAFCLISVEEDGTNSDDVAERKWACSPLFKHQKAGDISFLLKRIEEGGEPLKQLISKELEMRNNHDIILEEEEHSKVDDSKTSDFIRRFIDGECEHLDHWLLRFAGQAALAAKGGPLMAKTRRSSIACFLLHTGVLEEARLIERYFLMKPGNKLQQQQQQKEAVSASSPVENSVDEELDDTGAPHPSTMLINVWRASTRVLERAIQVKLSTQVSYDTVAEPLLEKASLLMHTQPNSDQCCRLEYVERSETSELFRELDDWKRKAKLSTLNVKTSHSEILDPLISFFLDRQVKPNVLKRIFEERAWRALLRCAGFNACLNALPYCHVKSCLIQWLPAFSAGGPLDSEPQTKMNEISTSSTAHFISALDFEDLGLLTALQSTSSLNKANDRSHYLYGLEGCGRWPSACVRTSFESLYSALTAILDESSESDSIATLDLFNFPLKVERDFDFLVEIQFFEKVKRVLDFSRDVDGLEGEPLRMRTLLLNAALRVLTCLAHQIVTENHIVSNSKELLKKNIFKMTFEELKSSSTFTSSLDEPYCYQILNLLFAVSVIGPQICQAFLCSDWQWIQLLFKISKADSSRIQQRALRLLSRVLPESKGNEEQNTMVEGILERIREAFPNPQSNQMTLSTTTIYAARSAAASECIGIIRKLLNTPNWKEVTNKVLLNSLTSNDSDSSISWPCLCILGGFYDPLRCLGLVKFINPPSSEFEGSTGIVVGVFENQKCHVVLPGVSQGDDSETAPDDSLKTVSSKRSAGKTVVVCDKTDVVPVPEYPPPSIIQDNLKTALSNLFDRYTEEDEEPKENQDQQEKTEDINSKVGKAVIRSALARMIPFILGENMSQARLRKILKLAVKPTETMGLKDIHAVGTWWRSLNEVWFDRRSSSSSSSSLPPSNEIVPQTMSSATSTTSITPPPTEVVADENPALRDMLALDMGFPMELCQIALDQCNNDVEAAINFCLEHAKDTETLIEEYRWSRQNPQRNAEQRRSAMVIEKLQEMGFPHNWCVKALEAVSYEGFNPALTWILANGDSLQEQDEAAEKAEKIAAANASTVPSTTTIVQQPAVVVEEETRVPRLVCTSGGQHTTHLGLDSSISIKPALGEGGFPSVAATGLLLTHGKWYYEAILETESCMQLGWVDSCFTGDAFEGTGVGDDAHSWAFDGFRKLKWHLTSTSWGKGWKIGDVVGCAADLDSGELWFSLNGVWTEGMGLAFKGLVRGLTYVGGLCPAVSLNRTERLKFNFGPKFLHSFPPHWNNEGNPVSEGFENSIYNLKYQHKIQSNIIIGDEIFSPFENVDDCFEEAVGDALSDRYFSSGQFASSSLLARRSSSGASGPAGTSSSSGHASSGNNNPFYVKEPFPLACALTNNPQNPHAAFDELLRVEKSDIGDGRIVKSIEQTCEALLTLYSRAAYLFLLLNWNKLDNKSKNLLSDSEEEEIWLLFKSCSGKLKVSEVFGAVGTVVGDDSGDVLTNLTSVAKELITTRMKLKSSILKFVIQELALACSRSYAIIPWDDSDLAQPLLVHSIWSVCSDDNSFPMNEKKLSFHPSLRFCTWATDVLKTVEKENLIKAWTLSLRTSSTRMKIVAARILVSFADEDSEMVKKICGNNFDVKRLEDVAYRCMSRSGTISLQAVPSKYTMAICELCAALSDFH